MCSNGPGAERSGQVKESTRWVEGYGIVADLAASVPETQAGVPVADRKGDLRGGPDRWGAVRRDYPADWLVRAMHPRNTATARSCGSSSVKARCSVRWNWSHRPHLGGPHGGCGNRCTNSG